MRRALALVLATVLAVAACVEPPPGDRVGPMASGSGYTWTYVKGPHGENCLVLTYGPGTHAGMMGMACDTVVP